MPTIEQIRAARALLGWSQSDLAKEAGLSQTGIARLENGTHRPNASTMEKIVAAFDRADIEFLGERGLERRTGEVRTLKGQEGFMTLMNEVYETARSKGGEICLFNGVPRLFTQWLGEDWYAMHAQRMAAIKNNFKLKIVIRKGDRSLIASGFAEYRWFPEEMFHDKTIYCYGDKIAFMNFMEDDLRILVLQQGEIADSFRILFNIAWTSVAVKFGEV